MMLIVKGSLGYIVRLLLYIVDLVLPVKKGQVLCWSFSGNQYGGNVKCISEELMRISEYYKVVWFKSKKCTAIFPSNIIVKTYNIWNKIIYMNTAEFLISDNHAEVKLWRKRKEQKYIMTWHGGIGNKKIEGDAIDDLPTSYIDNVKKNSKYADLFLSCSTFLSEQYRRAFWYDGEILEKGMPAYDIFYHEDKIEYTRKVVLNQLSIPTDSIIILYAPTFRKNHSIEKYKIDWGEIIKAIRIKTHKNIYVLIKLHPGLLACDIDISELTKGGNVFDVSTKGDIIPMMCASDMLISDYSSSIFEFGLLNKPGFIYAPDEKEYDRKAYFAWNRLPFPYASTQKQLIDNMLSFDYSVYINKLHHFYHNTLGVYEGGHATSCVVNWINNHRLKKL